MNVALQVFGAAGLIESFVEITYAMTNRHNFTNFEAVFFITSACCEVAGEIVFLFVACCMLSCTPGLWLSCHAKLISRDPIHNLAGGNIDENIGNFGEKSGMARTEYGILSYGAVAISSFSMVGWATFYPVWRKSFFGDGAGELRLALSIVSVCTIIPGVVFCVCPKLRSMMPSFSMAVMLFTVPVLYMLEKGFSVYILLSDFGRICSGVLGMLLLVLQILEVLSVIMIFLLGKCVVDVDNDEASPEETTPLTDSPVIDI